MVLLNPARGLGRYGRSFPYEVPGHKRATSSPADTDVLKGWEDSQPVNCQHLRKRTVGRESGSGDSKRFVGPDLPVLLAVRTVSSPSTDPEAALQSGFISSQFRTDRVLLLAPRLQAGLPEC